MYLTDNELQFITVLWNAEDPLTSTEILKRSVDKTWKDASLHTILTKLLQKGAIREVGYIKEGNIISRTFEPAIPCDEYYAAFFAEQTKKGTKTVPLIFSALIRNNDVSMETVQKLEAIIREKKAELQRYDE